MNKRIVNLTPHDINVVMADGEKRTYPYFVDESGGKITARVSTIERIVDSINGIPVMEVRYSDVVGLPPFEEGVFLIVSSIVEAAVRESGENRSDLLVPGMVVRDEGGKIIGCRGFQKLEAVCL